DDPVSHRLWEHALATALAADELDHLDGLPRGGSVFIAGLLHDTGKLLFHLADPKASADLPDDERVEEDVFGVAHSAVAACLAEQWGLDDDVVAGIMFHHRAEAGSISAIAARLAQADRIADQLGFAAIASATAPAATDDDAAVTARVAD